jgi:hypothetical protein
MVDGNVTIEFASALVTVFGLALHILGLALFGVGWFHVVVVHLSSSETYTHCASLVGNVIVSWLRN